MKNNINKKLYFKKIPLLVSLVILTISITICLNVYRTYLNVENISSAFIGDLQRIFNENERIALSISSRYYELISEGSCSKSILNAQLKGMVSNKSNIHSGSIDPYCLTTALEFINQKATSSLKKTYGVRYFYAPSINYLYFFSNNIDKNISISHLNKVIIDEGDKINIPEYYDRILSDNIKRKGLSTTNIYIDRITNEKTYTVVSHTYSVNKSQLIGNLFYDHTKSELNAILEKHISGRESKWLSAKLLESTSKELLCFFGSCSHTYISYNKKYSDKYDSIFNINILELLKSDTITLSSIVVILFFCIIIFISSAKAASRDYIKSMIDPLTRLYTRKALKYIKPATGSYFILCDVNKFKQINDTYGHDVGDIALQKISSVIQANIKPTDTAIRLGGDEFLLYISNSNLDHANSIVNSITTNLQENPLSFNCIYISLSISYGISEYNGELKESLRNADKNMYLNKNAPSC